MELLPCVNQDCRRVSWLCWHALRAPRRVVDSGNGGQPNVRICRIWVSGVPGDMPRFADKHTATAKGNRWGQQTKFAVNADPNVAGGAVEPLVDCLLSDMCGLVLVRSHSASVRR